MIVAAGVAACVSANVGVSAAVDVDYRKGEAGGWVELCELILERGGEAKRCHIEARADAVCIGALKRPSIADVEQGGRADRVDIIEYRPIAFLRWEITDRV